MDGIPMEPLDGLVHAQKSQWGITMGGSFWAQSAKVRDVWGVYERKHSFWELVRIVMLDGGFVPWQKYRGTISFCRAGKTISLASRYDDYVQIRWVHTVSHIRQLCYGLRVGGDGEESCSI